MRMIKRMNSLFARDTKSYEDRTEDLYKIIAKTTKRPLIFFDVEATEHCNLNCKGCGSMAPICEKEYLDLTKYENDIKRLSYLASGKMHRINILGGEPLLHPNIKDILKMTRSYFPIGVINLVTNGTLLAKQDDDFWSICKEKKVVIAPTIYPVPVDYDKLRTITENHGCIWKPFGNANVRWVKTTINENNNFNEAERFLKCSNANQCCILHDGRIYMCPRVAKIRHFNKKFGSNFIVCEEDFVDIYKVQSVSEILEYMCKPIPFCRYCGYEEQSKWGVSKGEKEEWIS